MGLKNKLSQRICKYVAANPGSLARQIGEALKFKHGSGMLTYMVKAGMIFTSGPRGWQRIYPTAALALEHHDRIVAEATATKNAKKQAHHKAQNAKRLAARKARRSDERIRVIPTRSLRPSAVKLPPGARLLPEVKITVARTPPPRFAPDREFVGVISSDWMLQRQGVNVRAQLAAG